MGGPTGMCGGDNVLFSLRHEPLTGYNKIQIRLHLLTSLGLGVTKLCFNLFSVEIDGQQKRSKIHLQPSQISKFSGEETMHGPPLRAPGVPLEPPLQMSSYGPCVTLSD